MGRAAVDTPAGREVDTAVDAVEKRVAKRAPLEIQEAQLAVDAQPVIGAGVAVRVGQKRSRLADRVRHGLQFGVEPSAGCEAQDLDGGV